MRACSLPRPGCLEHGTSSRRGSQSSEWGPWSANPRRRVPWRKTGGCGLARHCRLRFPVGLWMSFGRSSFVGGCFSCPYVDIAPNISPPAWRRGQEERALGALCLTKRCGKSTAVLQTGTTPCPISPQGISTRPRCPCLLVRDVSTEDLSPHSEQRVTFPEPSNN